MDKIQSVLENVWCPSCGRGKHFASKCPLRAIYTDSSTIPTRKSVRLKVEGNRPVFQVCKESHQIQYRCSDTQENYKTKNYTLHVENGGQTKQEKPTQKKGK
jgi:hypothetical protein